MNALRLRGVGLVAILLSSTELSPRSCALAAPAGVVAYVPQKPSRGLGAVLDWGLAKIERASARNQPARAPSSWLSYDSRF